MDVIKQLFDGIDDEHYEKLKKLSSRILRFRVIDENDVSRDFYLEKIYDYLDTVNIKNSINPRKYEYVSIYVDSLLALIDNKVVKGSRAEKYLKKAKSIESRIKGNEESCAELLKDFTRIFVSLYLECIKSDKPLENFDFTLSYDALQKAIEGMKLEKKAGLLWEKEKMVINIRNRYSKMTYNLFFLEMIYLNMLSIQEGEWYERNGSDDLRRSKKEIWR